MCALRLLSALQAAAGDLDHVARIVMLTVFVNAQDDFTDHSKVADGASDLIGRVFGDRGHPARLAVGAGSLPGGAAVEVAMIASLRAETNSINDLFKHARPSQTKKRNSRHLPLGLVRAN